MTGRIFPRISSDFEPHQRDSQKGKIKERIRLSKVHRTNRRTNDTPARTIALNAIPPAAIALFVISPSFIIRENRYCLPVFEVRFFRPCFEDRSHQGFRTLWDQVILELQQSLPFFQNAAFVSVYLPQQ